MDLATLKFEIRRMLASAGSMGNRMLKPFGCRLYSLANLPLGVDVSIDIKKLRRGLALGVIFDIGANQGQTMRYFAREFAGSQVFCFEPVKATFGKLQRNAKKFKGVRVFQHGFGEEPGEFEIYLHGNSGENSLVVKPHSSGGEPPRTEVIKIHTIDAFCEAEKVSRIDLLKIDTEGFEMQVPQRGRADAQGGALGPCVCGDLFRCEGQGAYLFFRRSTSSCWRTTLRSSHSTIRATGATPLCCEYANVLYVNLGMKRGNRRGQIIP